MQFLTRQRAIWKVARVAGQNGVMFCPRRRLNIYEHQAKYIMEQYGVNVQEGGLAETPEAAADIGRKLFEKSNASAVVLKAQVLAGGRGKGVYDDGFKGGIHLVTDPEKIHATASKMLHKRLITKQTDAKGEPVKSLLVLSSIDFDKEMYLAILMDRQNRGPVLVYSTEGGMDIEAVAAKDASKVVRRPLQYLAGITDADAAAVSADLGIAPPLHKKFRKQLRALYKLFCFEHATQVEINPLVIARNPKLAGGEQDVFCVDAKLQIDDNAPKDNRRVATTLAQGAEGENDARTELAQKMGLSYIPLDGNIGCMVNGAGLAMATMDVIAQKGARPANFLDVGGGADEAQVKAALELILSDEKVRVILVNIFGGILRCDVLARGIVGAARAVGLRVPMVVRLEGTNSEEGRRILSESGLEMHTADNMDDAAQIAVELCGPEEVVGK